MVGTEQAVCDGNGARKSSWVGVRLNCGVCFLLIHRLLAIFILLQVIIIVLLVNILPLFWNILMSQTTKDVQLKLEQNDIL